MELFRIPNPAAAVATAVRLAGHLPSGEIVMFTDHADPLLPNVAVAAIPGELTDEWAAALRRGLARIPGIDAPHPWVVVVFGTP
ncbi:MAG TPA: hypothetical protein VIW24_20470, partial [Aldersonia sp.]